MPRVSKHTMEVVNAENQRPEWTDEVLQRLDEENPMLADFLRERLAEAKNDGIMFSIFLSALVFYEAIRTEIANQDFSQQFETPSP